MKKLAVCFLILISTFSLFAADVPVKNGKGQMHFHGKRMLQRQNDFFVRQIGIRFLDEAEQKGTEIIFMFSSPVDARSILREEIFINGKQCSDDVKIRYTKSGDGLSFFIPDDFDDGENGGVENFSIELGNIKSYNGTPIEESKFENIEVAKNSQGGQIRIQKYKDKKIKETIDGRDAN